MKNLMDETLSEERDGFIVEFADQLRNEGFEQGMKQGILEGIRLGISLKFGDGALSLMPKFYEIRDLSILKKVGNSIRSSNTIEELLETIC